MSTCACIATSAMSVGEVKTALRRLEWDITPGKSVENALSDDTEQLYFAYGLLADILCVPLFS